MVVMNKYYIYRLDKYNQKKYFLGDKKFVCWMASTCGATSFDNYFGALEQLERIANTENINITELHIEVCRNPCRRG